MSNNECQNQLSQKVDLFQIDFSIFSEKIFQIIVLLDKVLFQIIFFCEPLCELRTALINLSKNYVVNTSFTRLRWVTSSASQRRYIIGLFYMGSKHHLEIASYSRVDTMRREWIQFIRKVSASFTSIHTTTSHVSRNICQGIKIRSTFRRSPNSSDKTQLASIEMSWWSHHSSRKPP